LSAPPVHGYTDQPRDSDEPRSRSWSRVPTRPERTESWDRPARPERTESWDRPARNDSPSWSTPASRTGSWATPADMAGRTGSFTAPVAPVVDPQPSWGYADDGSWVGAAGAGSAPAGTEWWADAPPRAREAWTPPPGDNWTGNVPPDEDPDVPSKRRKATKIALVLGALAALVVVGLVAFAGTVLLGGGSGGNPNRAGGAQSPAIGADGNGTPGYPAVPQPSGADQPTPGATTPAPTKKPTTGPAVPGGALAQPAQESAVLSIVNKNRGDNHCKALTFSAKLSDAARKHSADMAARHYFSHDTPEGVSMAARITDEGYKWSMVGENIAEGQKDAKAVMAAWMNSPGHRANILNCQYTQIGIGLAYQGKTPVWTQDFGTPR
jgi:uncharacterized protein YkwD